MKYLNNLERGTMESTVAQLFDGMEDMNAGSMKIVVDGDKLILLVHGKQEVQRLNPLIEKLTDEEAGI